MLSGLVFWAKLTVEPDFLKVASTIFIYIGLVFWAKRTVEPDFLIVVSTIFIYIGELYCIRMLKFDLKITVCFLYLICNDSLCAKVGKLGKFSLGAPFTNRPIFLELRRTVRSGDLPSHSS